MCHASCTSWLTAISSSQRWVIYSQTNGAASNYTYLFRFVWIVVVFWLILFSNLSLCVFLLLFSKLLLFSDFFYLFRFAFFIYFVFGIEICFALLGHRRRKSKTIHSLPINNPTPLKWKWLSFTHLSLQTHKTFIHLRNTNEHILNEIWHIYVPHLTVLAITTLML